MINEQHIHPTPPPAAPITGTAFAAISSETKTPNRARNQCIHQPHVITGAATSTAPFSVK